MSAHSCNVYCELDQRFHEIQKEQEMQSVEELHKYLSEFEKLAVAARQIAKYGESGDD